MQEFIDARPEYLEMIEQARKLHPLYNQSTLYVEKTISPSFEGFMEWKTNARIFQPDKYVRKWLYFDKITWLFEEKD